MLKLYNKIKQLVVNERKRKRIMTFCSVNAPNILNKVKN